MCWVHPVGESLIFFYPKGFFRQPSSLTSVVLLDNDDFVIVYRMSTVCKVFWYRILFSVSNVRKVDHHSFIQWQPGLTNIYRFIASLTHQAVNYTCCFAIIVTFNTICLSVCALKRVCSYYVLTYSALFFRTDRICPDVHRRYCCASCVLVYLLCFCLVCTL